QHEHRWGGGDQGWACRIGPHEAARAAGAPAAPAIAEAHDAAVGVDFEVFLGGDRPQARATAEHVVVVAGEQHDRVLGNLDRFGAIEHQPHAALGDEVEGDDRTRVRLHEPAVLGGDLRVDAPGGREFAVEEDPAVETDDPKQV